MDILINKTGTSSTYDLTSLKNEGKVYVMDNHMAAGWCWAQKINFEKSYNLFHIDKHYDLLEGGLERNIKAISDSKFDLKKSTINEYCSLEYPKKSTQERNQVFRFDNYMTIIKSLYPNIFDKLIFATHNDGTVPSDWSFYEPKMIDLTTENVSYWINEKSTNWIINIDIDYFFTKNRNDEYFQFLSDEYIIEFAKELNSVWDKIEVLTIALSPTFCGGLENSSRISGLILDQLGINIE